jgi:hypothetical protein
MLRVGQGYNLLVLQHRNTAGKRTQDAELLWGDGGRGVRGVRIALVVGWPQTVDDDGCKEWESQGGRSVAVALCSCEGCEGCG